jgi:hypothetical protein
MNNVRHETNTIFRNKMREYLKENINECETNRKKKKYERHIRGIKELCYQLRT